MFVVLIFLVGLYHVYTIMYTKVFLFFFFFVSITLLSHGKMSIDNKIFVDLNESVIYRVNLIVYT